MKSNSRILGLSGDRQDARRSDNSAAGQSRQPDNATIRPLQYVCDLQPYQPGLPIELVARQHGLDPAKVVKLASNENPLGMSPKARAALEDAAIEAHRYPDLYALTQKLAQKLGVNPSQIVLGNGSNDVLDLVAQTFLNDGDESVSSQYAFAVYPIATQSVGAKNVIVPAKEYGHDLDAMLAAITPKTKVIWIANPNNPTGTFIPYSAVKGFMGKVPANVAVVLDEAYYEYLDDTDRDDAVRWLAEHPNLIIARTFSKIYGLAGLRIGYAITSPEVAGLMNRVRQPFNANSLALAAATAALDDDAHVVKTREMAVKGREMLVKGLQNLGLECLPAYGNFVTFKVGDAARVNQQLLEQGVIVRPLAPYDMADWLRVTIGSERENGQFLQALAAVMVA